MKSGYLLQQLTAPVLEPVTVAFCKSWARVDADLTDEDELFAFWISAARELAEKESGRVFIERHFELALDEFPCDRRIRIPITPLIDVVSIHYVDREGVTQLLDASNYDVVRDAPPHLCANVWSGQNWPSLVPRTRNVVIEFTAGYPGDGSPGGAENVPFAAKHAIAATVSHWYENREAIATDLRMAPTEMPLSAQRMLDTLKVYYP